MPCYARIIRGPARRDNELGNKINEKMKKNSFEDVDYKFDEPSQGLGGGVNNLIKSMSALIQSFLIQKSIRISNKKSYFKRQKRDFVGARIKSGF
jgi:hypothetical protein